MTTLIGVLGSVTPPGRLRSALAYALAAVSEADGAVKTRLIDLAEHRIGFAGAAALEQMTDDAPAVVQAITEADAVIFASPVYRASFTGALKNLLDLIPVETLQGKPCGILAMGATQHHYLGVDWHLRDVLTWFGAAVTPTSVYLASADFKDGQPDERAQGELRALATSVLRFHTLLQSEAGPLGPTPLAAQRRA